MSTDSLRAHTLCQYSVTFHFPQRLPTEDTCVTSPKDGSVSFPNLLQTRERQVVLWRLLHAIVGSRTPALSSLPNSSVRAKTIRCQAPPPQTRHLLFPQASHSAYQCQAFPHAFLARLGCSKMSTLGVDRRKTLGVVATAPCQTLGRGGPSAAAAAGIPFGRGSHSTTSTCSLGRGVGLASPPRSRGCLAGQ